MILILVISLFPVPISASIHCTEEGEVCYDPNLEIQIGNIFKWVVIENHKDGHSYDYGVDSDSQLEISINLIDDFRGRNDEEIEENWQQYFDVELTIDDNAVNNVWVGAFQPVSFYPAGIPNWYRLITPTLIVNESRIINIYQVMVQRLSEFIIVDDFGDQWNYTTYYTRSISDEIYVSSYYYKISEKSNSSNIVFSELLEHRIDIEKGLILQMSYEEQDIYSDTNASWVVKLKEYEDLQLDFSGIRDNMPLLGGLFALILVVATFFTLIYRKMDSYFQDI